MRDLILVVTCCNDLNIGKMLSSVYKSNSNLSILIILVNQCNFDISKYSDSDYNVIYNINTDKLPLSKARNIGLQYIFNNEVKSSHIMFSDDDSIFDFQFFSNYLKFIENGKSYLVDVYCNNSFFFYKQNNIAEGKLLTDKHFENAISVNMVIDQLTFYQTGYFDERLGVGALYGAGEDGDYYIRCCQYTGFYNTHCLYNFHPAPESKYSEMTLKQIIDKFTSYGRGVIFMLCKHRKYLSALYSCFKAIGGCVISIFKLDYQKSIAYLLAFFARSLLFMSCVVNRSRYF